MMRGYLLDTCVISESTRAEASDSVLAWLDATAPESLYMSVVTLGEIEQGIGKLGNNQKARTLEHWLHETVTSLFESRTLDVDANIAHRWGRMLGTAKRKGRSLPLIDTLLAATAQEHELVLVTRNTRDFSNLDIELFNPWQ
ncbi:MAG: type II toxin-antitoxin system VapC family toxin [Dokdonella sp.]